MTTVGGIFTRRADAENAIELLRAIGIADERLALLSPGTRDEGVEEIMPRAETDESGTCEKVGRAKA